MAMMASKGDVLDAFDEGVGVQDEADARSVTEVEVRRSVAEGVDGPAEVDDWICDAAYSLWTA